MSLTAQKENQEEIFPGTRKKCIECGEPLKSGSREDAKFCTDACRTSYNNKKRKERQQVRQQPSDSDKEEMNETDYIQKIIAILVRNHEILCKIATTDEPVKMEMRDLMGRGFNFKFFTSEAPTQNGDIYRFCFDRGYKQTPDGFVIIVQREREVIC